MLTLRLAKRLAIVTLAASLMSCSRYFEPTHLGEAEIPTDVLKLSADFASVLRSVIGPRCLECHSQFSSYRSVRTELPEIIDSVLSGQMPKRGGPLSQEEKEILLNWANRGAREFADEEVPEQIPSTLEPTWQSISEKLIFPKCLVCHNPRGEAKFLDLSSRQLIYEQRGRKFLDGQTLIQLDSPETSYLVQIVQDPAEPMPPIKSGIRGLDQNEIAVLIEWIRRGLP